MTVEQNIAYYLGYSLNHYLASDTDEPAGGPNYYGFLDKQGNFYIMKVTISGDTQTIRYMRGTGLALYQTSWSDRANLTYKYASEIF